MPWTKPFDVFLQNNQSFGGSIQVLTDGTILGVRGTVANILTPDEYGSYENGTVKRIAGPEYEHGAACWALTNDGKVWFHGSEGGSGASHCSVFNPITEKWISYYGTNAASHTPLIVLPDGRQYGYKQLPANATSPTEAVNLESSFVVFAQGESGFSLLPDDRVALCSSGGPFINLVRPQYSSEMVAAGSYDGDETSLSINVSSQMNALPTDWRSNKKDWSSNNKCTYEVGASMWMPKIGKMVMLGGQGWIFTYDPVTGTVDRPAVAPIEPLNSISQSWKWGTIRSTNNDQSQGTIITAGSITIDSTMTAVDASNRIIQMNNIHAVTGVTKGFYVYVNGNTEALEFEFTSVTHSGFDNGTFTFSGLKLGFTQNWTQTVSTSAEVVWGSPVPVTMDDPMTMLPNGDIIWVAKTEDVRIGNRPAKNRWLKWDGVSSVAEYVEPTNPDGTRGAFYLMPLPDGKILGNYGTIYSPTETEAIPLSGSRPVVTYFPDRIEPNQTITLYGQQLNGLHEGAAFGDDGSPKSVFPLVRFKNNADNKVYYARTSNFSYRGIGVARPSTCTVKIPTTIPPGNYSMEVVASGIPSTPKTVVVKDPMGFGGDAIIMTKFS